MKANELMIGDWVLDTYTNKPMRMEVISRDMGEGLEPIPLTPEILEKNGFKPDVPGDAYKYSYQIDSVSIVECYANAVGEGRHRGVISFGDTRLRITLVFVHELQHALRLCGIDKEIEL